MGIDIVAIYFKDAQGNLLATPMMGEPAYLCVECKSYKTIENANLGILIKSFAGENDLVLYLTSASDNQPLEISPGRVELQMQMPYCGLIPGVYSARIYVREAVYSFDIVEAFRFTVKANKNASRCLFYQPRNWAVIKK